jgi:hypothetical protein
MGPAQRTVTGLPIHHRHRVSPPQQMPDCANADDSSARNRDFHEESNSHRGQKNKKNNMLSLIISFVNIPDDAYF